MKKIRVLRLIEYTYASVEDMAHDMSRWTIQRVWGAMNGQASMKSTTLPADVIGDTQEEKRDA